MPEQEQRETGPDAVPPPYDRKRIALLNGACGQAGRIRLRGQVVDVAITQGQKTENWAPFHSLPESLLNSIRPMQDFSMLGVRRPRLQIEILDVAPADFVESRVDTYARLFVSDAFNAGDDSFFDFPVKADLAPGRYVVRVLLRGIDSLRQSVADLAYIRYGDSLILKKDLPIGYGRLRVLPADFAESIITSDIDQTFLDTPIHSRQGLIETLFQSPEAKTNIIGLPEFYHAIKAAGEIARPLIFISASPHFFRRTLSAVFERFEIEYSGLHLKHVQGAFDNVVRKVADTLLNLNEFLSQGLERSWERTFKFLGSSLQSLFDHISYKLITLLENRLMQPDGAREILMGDNTEGDYFIFTIYQFLMRGDLLGEELEQYLYNLNFQNREALTRDAARVIRRLTEENVALHGKRNPVAAVWINLARTEPQDAEMASIVRTALPESLQSQFDAGSGIVQPVACEAGMGFALAALDQGFITFDQAVNVLKASLGAEHREQRLDKTELARIVNEFNFRGPNPVDRAALLTATLG